MTARGLLLAAGAGSRMGTPKALVSDERGPWLPRGVRTLLDGGCEAVTVVLGAAAEEARQLLGEVAAGPEVDVVVASDWAEGMSASLRTGLRAVSGTTAEAALVHLVDLPDVGPGVVRRVLGSTGSPTGSPAGSPAGALARAAYGGRPGHPVLLGRDHWPPLIDGVAGDRGARDYLARREVALVECGDLASGQDVDSRA